MKEFFRKHGVPDGVGIKEKYNTRAAQLFKERVAAKVDVCCVERKGRGIRTIKGNREMCNNSV